MDLHHRLLAGVQAHLCSNAPSGYNLAFRIRQVLILQFVFFGRNLIVAMIVVGANPAFGQNYPVKTIRIVTGSVGGAADLSARLIAQGISSPLEQSVVVENQSKEEPAALVAKAPPDGYTLLLGGNLTWLAPLLRDTPWDPVRDLLPITMAAQQPLILVAHPSVAINSVKDLIALAKATPGVLNYSLGTLGGTSHLSMELFKSMTSLNIVGIPYNGTGAVALAVVRNEVQITFIDPSAGTPYIRAGRLKSLAVTSAQPSALAPGLPTVAASGVPGYESGNASAMFAPAKTPEAIVRRLNREVVRELNRPDIKEKYFDTGVETVGSSPEELAAKMKSEMLTMGKVIADAGLRLK